MLKLNTVFWIFFWFVFLFAVSCQQEETNPSIEHVTGYFPLRPGNEWTYTREGITDGQVTHTDTERWRVRSDFFLDLYMVTSAGEDLNGYKALFFNALDIDDMGGTFISTKYLKLPTDSLVLVAPDRWIGGGLVKMKTSFGELDCIRTKSTSQISGHQEDMYYYFCKDIGVYLIEHQYIYEDQTGNSYIGYIWRRTLTDFKVD